MNHSFPKRRSSYRFQVCSDKSNRSGPGAEGAAHRLYNVKINNIAAGESILEAPRRFAVAILREIKQVSLGRYRYEAICEHHCGPQVAIFVKRDAIDQTVTQGGGPVHFAL